MRLSDKEADILACVELKADVGMSYIRKVTGYRDHTIRYALKSLEERGIIQRTRFIDVCKLGYTLHNIFFSIGSESKQLKADIIEALRQARHVTWIAEMGSDFQFGLGVTTKSLNEVQELLNELSDRFGNIFFQKTVSSQFSATFFPRTYLSSKKGGAKPIRNGVVTDTVHIDSLDDMILQELALCGGSSHRRIAQQLQIPLSTLELRVKKLKEKGVITRTYYAVDSTKFGMEPFKLIVYAKAVNPSLSRRLYNFCEAHRNVINIYECFGSWDFEIGVEVQTAQDVVNVTQEVYETVGDDVNTIKVLSKFRDLKAICYPVEHETEAKLRVNEG